MLTRRFGIIVVSLLSFAIANGAEPGGSVVEPPDILRVVVDAAASDTHLANAESLVQPDGTFSLGTAGRVRVAGLTIEQVKEAIAKRFSARAKTAPAIRVQVDLVAANSKVCFVIYPGKDGEMLRRSELPITQRSLRRSFISKGLPRPPRPAP